MGDVREMLQLEEEHKTQIEQIVEGMRCKLWCYKSGFTYLSKVKDIGMKTFLVCLEEPQYPQNCGYSIPFGYGYFCKCPLRVYIAKTFKA